MLDHEVVLARVFEEVEFGLFLFRSPDCDDVFAQI